MEAKMPVFRLLGWILIFALYLFTVTQSDTLIWIACAIAFYTLIYLVTRWTRLGGFQGVGLSRHRRWKTLLVTGFAIGALLQLAEWLVMWWIGGSDIVAINTDASSILVSGIITLASTAFIGFGEEILFRGYLFAALPKSTLIVAGVSIIMFTGAHILTKSYESQLNTTIYLSVYGIAAAYTYIKTRSLWFLAGVHTALISHRLG